MRAETSASISSWTSQRTDSRRKSPPGSSPLRRSSNNAILSSATVRLLSGCWSDNLHGKPTVASSSRPAFYTTPRDSIQGTQKVGMQWRPDSRTVAFLNVFDILHDRGLDSWLQSARQVPPPFDSSGDTGLPFEQVVSRHLAILDANSSIRQFYLSNSRWL